MLSVGEVLDAGAQDVADPVERIVFAAAVAVDVLLDPATDLVDGGRAEFSLGDEYWKLIGDGVGRRPTATTGHNRRVAFATSSISSSSAARKTSTAAS